MVELLYLPILAVLQVAFALLASPLLIGIMRKVKARFQGRVGAPIVQPYIDLRKLLSKGTAKSSGAIMLKPKMGQTREQFNQARTSCLHLSFPQGICFFFCLDLPLDRSHRC